jgi:SAM-dependent methyltransferase
MNFPVSSRARADLALAVYLEPHAEGRRVLLLGEAEGVLADRFDQLAKHLEIIDPAAREPSSGEVPELPFDDATFDLVVVCDLATLPDPVAGALRELRRVLSPDGLLVVGSPAETKRRRRGPPQHVALDGLLTGEFRNVRVLTQTPLAGYALGERERQRGEEFSIDSSLVRDAESEPERYLGLASDLRLPVEPRLWVQVPVSAQGEGAASSEQAPAALFEELRRAEDEAREALHREADLLRKLESERRARSETEQLAERARVFERKLLAAEADYDDAVARVRYFESTVGEHEAAAQHDRERREASERELAHAKSELAGVADKLRRLEAERDGARADHDVTGRGLAELEQRLVELGKQVLSLEQDKKHHEKTARDLLEELRRLERDSSASVEHDARVAELEAERDRAVQRSLEAEVAREAAQMRTDELRSELEAQTALHSAQPRAEEPSAADASRYDDGAELTRTRAELAHNRGERQGLRLRLEEAELALLATSSPGQQLRDAVAELAEVRLRLAHTDALLHAIREAQPSQRSPFESTFPLDGDRVRELEAQLVQADQRLAELTRELEEADRFAELHAEDAERLGQVESALESSRGRLEDLEDELRALEQEVRSTREEVATAREQAERATSEAHARLERAERHEAERDDARAALAEARSILSQLANRVGADENDPPSIVEALQAQRDAQTGEADRMVEALRSELASRDARIAQLELRLSERRELGEGNHVQTSDSSEY